MMYYRATGNGPPIVFVHGAAGTGRLFGNQFQAFRDRRRCYFLDLPGHGNSDPEGDTGIEGYAMAVSGFLAGLNEPAILLGHSMGGAIALEIALDRPELVNRLVLVGTGCRLPVSEKLLTGLDTGYESTLASILGYCFSKTVDPELVARGRAEMSRIPPDVVRADFQACNSFNRCSRLSEIAAPALIVCGEKDVMTPVSFSRELSDGIPNAHLEIIPRGSHMVMLEAADAFNRILAPGL